MPVTATTNERRLRRRLKRTTLNVTGLDPATIVRIEVLMRRDGLNLDQFLAIAADAYALMLPGWPYALKDVDQCETV